MDLNLKWSKHNSKVNKFKNAITFGLPAGYSATGFKVCIGMGACASVCFAKQGFYVVPAVAAAREHNLTIIRSSVDDFKIKAIEDLTRMSKVKIVRVHDSGDMINQAYLNAWYDIARAFPYKKFYSYTKSLTLDLWTNKPINFTIIQSEGGIWDHLINKKKSHSRIFSSHYQRRKAHYRNGSNTDILALRGETRIGLRYHGVKALTATQRKFFNANISKLI